MKAEYNKWYKCEKGTMSENFENAQVKYNGRIEGSLKVVVQTIYGYIDTQYRYRTQEGEIAWRNYLDREVLAWMLPEPYKE